MREAQSLVVSVVFAALITGACTDADVAAPPPETVHDDASIRESAAIAYRAASANYAERGGDEARDRALLRQLADKSTARAKRALEDKLAEMSWVDSETRAGIQASLERLADPEAFARELAAYPQPGPPPRETATRGFVFQRPGPAGWYCYSPIFGKMGPHPDFWFSAFVCAWAQGALVLATNEGCFVFNHDPALVCW